MAIDKSLTLCLVNCGGKPFLHDSAPADTNRIRQILAGNPLKRLFAYAIALLDKTYPIWQGLTNPFFNSYLNLRGIDKGKIVHCKHSITIYDGSMSNKRNSCGEMVVGRWNVVVEAIYAATTTFQPSHSLPCKQLLAMDAKLFSILSSNEAVPICGKLIDLLKIVHVNMIPLSGSYCQATGKRMSI